jgi:endonuclease VIII
VPEGDSLHRAAARLQPLVGQVVSVEAQHPRARVLGVAEAIDGKRLARVHAVGKNLLLTFEEGLVLRSHLRMSGRWTVRPAGAPVAGKPWLVLRSDEHQAILRGGAVLELAFDATSTGLLRGRLGRLGPDVMAEPPDLDAMVARFRAADQDRELGDALLDQRLVAGIGNMWRAEGLFLARVSPWARLRDVSDEELRRVLEETAAAMHAPRRRRLVYGKVGRPCPRCAVPIAAWRQGDDARTAYWCPACQGTPARAPRQLARRT